MRPRLAPPTGTPSSPNPPDTALREPPIRRRCPEAHQDEGLTLPWQPDVPGDKNTLTDLGSRLANALN